MIAWVDVETTGLDPREDNLLEVGMIITDDNLNERARKAVVLRPPANVERLLKPVVLEMHRKGEGNDTYFKVEVLGKDGTKTKIELNARGERPEAIGYPKMGLETKDDKKSGKGKE